MTSQSELVLATESDHVNNLVCTARPLNCTENQINLNYCYLFVFALATKTPSSITHLCNAFESRLTSFEWFSRWFALCICTDLLSFVWFSISLRFHYPFYVLHHKRISRVSAYARA